MINHIVNVFPFEADVSTSSLNSLKYQLRLNELYDLADVSLTHYVMTQQRLNLIQSVFTGKKSFDFNRHTDELWIYMDWENDVILNDYIIIEAYKIIDPDTYTDVYNDMFLKQYVTSLFKEQWGLNLSKFEGVQMPGGVTLNGRAILEDARTEIAQLQEQMSLSYELPVDFMVG